MGGYICCLFYLIVPSEKTIGKHVYADRDTLTPYEEVSPTQ